MEKPKISVIVPIYNVEKYLKKCLNSLWNQTYDNIEYIFVDDDSTDNSKKILLEEVKGKKNIVIIENEKNRGLSYCRNVGLSKATGSYISYIDSDDYIEKDYYKSLMGTALEKGSNIVVCGIRAVQGEKIVSTICGGNKKQDFIDNGLAASACNKLFKKSIISEYPFEEGKSNEDIGVILPLVINSSKVHYNDEVNYYYVQRNNSVQNSKVTAKRFDVFEGVELALSRIKEQKEKEKYQDIIIFHQIIMFLFYVIITVPNNKDRRVLLKKFHKLSKKYSLLKNKRLNRFYGEVEKIYRIYYKSILFLGERSLFLLENCLISLYHKYKKRKKKRVIKQDIIMDDLIFLAKNQKNLPQDVKVSVVVPNYNYEKYLFQRIYSILNQTMKVEEIIILDDCSTDGSRETIDQIVDQLTPYISIRKIYNIKNSKIPFKQWQKGITEAVGDYIWIAEADDYCEKFFLEKLIQPILSEKEVIISYCDTSFINQEGEIILKSVRKQIDIQKTGHWNHSYILPGPTEFQQYTYLNCTIANVSSALIKKDHYKNNFEEAVKYRQAGDWIFYASLMQNKTGKVAYTAQSLNYYRVHDNNVSTTIKKIDHLNEIKKIHNYYMKHYGLTQHQLIQIKMRYEFLEKAWKIKK